MKTLLSRVEEEAINSTSLKLSLHHLKMSHAHLFEETEGRDVDNLLSDIETLINKLESRVNS